MALATAHLARGVWFYALVVALLNLLIFFKLNQADHRWARKWKISFRQESLSNQSFAPVLPSPDRTRAQLVQAVLMTTPVAKEESEAGIQAGFMRRKPGVAGLSMLPSTKSEEPGTTFTTVAELHQGLQLFSPPQQAGASLAQQESLIVETALNLSKSGQERQWILLLMINNAFLPMLDSWLCSLESRGLTSVLDSAMFLAVDPVAADYLQVRKLRSLNWLVSQSGEMQYGKQNYYELMKHRVNLVLRLLRAGVPLFLCETDQVWLENPVEYVRKHFPRDELITYDDSKDQKGKLPCCGFMFLRPSRNLIEVWAGVAASVNQKPDNEQVVLKNILQKKKWRASFLPKNSFRNGLWFSMPDAEKQRSLHSGSLHFIHANWMIGTSNKEQALKKDNFWWTFDNGRCKRHGD